MHPPSLCEPLCFLLSCSQFSQQSGRFPPLPVLVPVGSHRPPAHAPREGSHWPNYPEEPPKPRPCTLHLDELGESTDPPKCHDCWSWHCPEALPRSQAVGDCSSSAPYVAAAFRCPSAFPELSTSLTGTGRKWGTAFPAGATMPDEGCMIHFPKLPFGPFSSCQNKQANKHLRVRRGFWGTGSHGGNADSPRIALQGRRSAGSDGGTLLTQVHSCPCPRDSADGTHNNGLGRS